MIIWDLKCILISDLVTKCHELTHALEINELKDYMYLCTEPTKNNHHVQTNAIKINLIFHHKYYINEKATLIKQYIFPTDMSNMRYNSFPKQCLYRKIHTWECFSYSFVSCLQNRKFDNSWMFDNSSRVLSNHIQTN